MNTLFASFQPTDDVANLLSSLQQASLGWIAEEIETNIRNGNAVAKLDSQGKLIEYATVPFDTSEQLRLTLRTIQRYTIELYKTWSWTRDHLLQALAGCQATDSFADLDAIPFK